MENNYQLPNQNSQITLTKFPTKDYPLNQQVFALTNAPPPSIEQLQQGEVVVQNIFLAIGPAMRVWISGVQTYTRPIKQGDIMFGSGIAEVIYSKDQKFSKGDIVLGLTYWQRYSVLKSKGLTLLPKNYKDYTDFLGVLGNSGLTAYFGINKIAKLKAGQTVIVSAAAGAVGEIALQLAKLAGCIVIGIAGSKQKCQYIKSLGADHAIDYKNQSLKLRLKETCPNGVDVYFDNVGGEILDEILLHIRQYSRVVACGSISTYNEDANNKYGLKNYQKIIIKRATIQGFIYFDYSKQFPEAIAELERLIKEGNLKNRVDIYKGLQAAPLGLKSILLGKNNGKVIIKLKQ